MDISSIFVLVQSENTCYSMPLKTIQPSISNWLHSTLLIFNPRTTVVRLINKTLLFQNGITQPRNAQVTNVSTYISRLLEALQGWTGSIYNCTHWLSHSGDIPHRNPERYVGKGWKKCFQIRHNTDDDWGHHSSQTDRLNAPCATMTVAVHS
jgi:hypothetical protein